MEAVGWVTLVVFVAVGVAALFVVAAIQKHREAFGEFDQSHDPVTSAYDKFAKKMELEYADLVELGGEFVSTSRKFQMKLQYKFKHGEPETFYVVFVYDASTRVMRFNYRHQVTLLIDGESYEATLPLHRITEGRWGGVSELIHSSFDTKILSAICNGKSVECKVGSLEFRFSKRHLHGAKCLLARADLYRKRLAGGMDTKPPKPLNSRQNQPRTIR